MSEESKPHSTQRDFDVMALAIQNTTNDGLRLQALDALKCVEEQYEVLARKNSCDYETGTGQNCGECRDCLAVNWHFAQEVVANLKEQFEVLRNFAEACCEIVERSHNPLDEITKRLVEVRPIAYPAKEPTYEEIRKQREDFHRRLA